MEQRQKLRIAALGDLHIHEQPAGTLRGMFEELSEKADLVVLCGDLTNLGLPKEAENLAADLAVCQIPVIGILGNHDFESNHAPEIKKILSSAKMAFVDDEPLVLKGIGFVGVKGFGGGFERHIIGHFGEPATKAFVNEGVSEALHLENLLEELSEVERIAIMLHYSPIVETVRGEPEVIFPFLGSSRMAEVIDRFEPSVVFHGHAHHGQPQGKTFKGVPVFNVSMDVQRRLHPNQPYLIYEV